MRKLYYLPIGIACLFFTIGHAQAKDKSVNTEIVDQNLTTSSNALTDAASEEEEFKAQLKEQRKLEIENSLIRARLERELADLRAEIERLRWQKEVKTLKWEIEQADQVKVYEKEIMALNREKEKIMAINALSQAQMTQVIEQFNLNTADLQNKSALLKLEADKLRSEIEQTKAKQERNKHAAGEPTYLENPLRKDGTLVISDRSIKLNGPITPWLANYVMDRIQYFNNKDKTQPIFIAIDYSPGGSSAAGYSILTAMENSQAPIHVVVKSFAASMAALIVSLANKSYAYPNALLLHHQPWTYSVGNIREIKEDLDRLQEEWKRLGGRLAAKMGISLDKLDKQLYEKSANGDWLEFADHAHKIKWLDHIITGIEDTASRELPDPIHYSYQSYLRDYLGSTQKTDDIQNGAIYLPILGPKDFYYMYDPDKRYQVMSVK
jgi:ATP-dependent Clp protease protease subunit